LEEEEVAAGERFEKQTGEEFKSAFPLEKRFFEVYIIRGDI
jgi:hypothetical protein